MVQIGIDNQFRSSYLTISEMVEDYLKNCYSCRNDRVHLVNHIHKKYPNANPETIRRSSQHIQNDVGMYLAEIPTQMVRQAREKWMRDEGHLL